MKKMKWKKFLWKAIIYAMRFITVTAGLFLILSIVAMIEQWSMSGEPLIVFVSCIVWFAFLGLLAWLEKKFGI